MLLSALTGLPGWASTRIRPSAGASPLSSFPHWTSFSRSLAHGRSVFGDALIERHRCATAAPAPENNLRDAPLLLEELHTGVDVQRHGLEPNQRLVVVRPRVHAQDRKTPSGQLGAGERAHEVRCAVHHENGQREAPGPPHQASRTHPSRRRVRRGIGCTRVALGERRACDEHKTQKGD